MTKCGNVALTCIHGAPSGQRLRCCSATAQWRRTARPAWRQTAARKQNKTTKKNTFSMQFTSFPSVRIWDVLVWTYSESKSRSTVAHDGHSCKKTQKHKLNIYVSFNCGTADQFCFLINSCRKPDRWDERKWNLKFDLKVANRCKYLCSCISGEKSTSPGYFWKNSQRPRELLAAHIVSFSSI